MRLLNSGGRHAPGAVRPAIALLAFTCGLAACSMAPRRSAAEQAYDAQLADRVQAALLADPDIYARHIDVVVERGVVHLGGYVWEIGDFRLARRDAASIPGVKTVLTEMELMRGGVGGSGR
jgi:osmotically-inducible protein OsmY